MQGRGLGSALLAFLTDRADAAGLHAYLEATNERGVTLYERFGFVVEEVRTGVRTTHDWGTHCTQCAGGPPAAP